MDLSEIQCLPIEDKLKWLRSSEGLVHLQQWLSEGLTLKNVTQKLCIHDQTLYRWRRYPEIAVVVVNAGYKEVKPSKPDLSRDPAYRLICGLDYYMRGTILEEYGTAEKLWKTPFIKSYFKSFGVSESAYYTDYLEKVLNGNIYHLSNTFCIAYCEINRRGIIKPLKSPYN